MQQALLASAKVAEQAVHGARIPLSGVKALLGVMLQSDLGMVEAAGIDLCAALSALLRLMPGDGEDACLENIGAATIEAAFPALQDGLTQGQFR